MKVPWNGVAIGSGVIPARAERVIPARAGRLTGAHVSRVTGAHGLLCTIHSIGVGQVGGAGGRTSGIVIKYLPSRGITMSHHDLPLGSWGGRGGWGGWACFRDIPLPKDVTNQPHYQIPSFRVLGWVGLCGVGGSGFRHPKHLPS